MFERPRPIAGGRGSAIHPPNRFGGPTFELDPDQLEHDAESIEGLRKIPTTYLVDRARSVVTENDSPDVGFRYSLNPYRGCAHGCSYCYARRTHEYLGFDAGLDFETKILVKEDAAALFRTFLARPGWAAEPIAMSGATDPYQPAERSYRLSRRCLEVAAEARQPMELITKNALVVRDLDLLRELASFGAVHVNVSITTLDQELARVMEPRTSSPAARLRAIGELGAAGVPVRVMVAPVIPGLNDHEIPAIVRAAAEAGARSAATTLIRLPETVEPVFVEWLERTQPTRAARVLGRIRQVRGGACNDSTFGRRMTGTGVLAEQIRSLFRLARTRHGLDGDLPPLDRSQFRPPTAASGQGWLF